MKAAVTEGKGDIKLVDVPVPEAGPYQCLCKILACATCTGTDKKVVKSTIPWKVTYPGIVGHESVGTVLKRGKKARYIREGDIFLRPTAVYSGSKLGPYSSMLGGFAEYGLVTDVKALLEDNPGTAPGYAQFQMKIPEDVIITPADATMVITLKETAGYVADMNLSVNSSVLLLGTGSVAMSMSFFSKIYGAFPLIAAGRRDEPLDSMKKFGANFTVNTEKEALEKKVMEITGGNGVDYIIDTAGNADLFIRASRILGENGKIAPYATYDNPEKLQSVDKRFIMNARTGEVRTHRYLFDLVKLGIVDPGSFYSHRMPFSEITKGFEMIENREAFKIVFEME